VTAALAGWSRLAEDVPHRGLGLAVAITLACVCVVVLASDAFLFLFAWEGLSLAFYLLSGYWRQRSGRTFAAMLTFGFSKTSGGLLLIAFGLLFAATGSLRISDWAGAQGAARDAGYALALTGFAAKVGVLPLQVWMPTGYSAAPGPARALMSAVAANVGFYGMWRTLQILGAPPTWLAVLVLITAAATALLGIAHAAVQKNLQRVIAYSSVENGGLITVGFAIAMVGATAGEKPLIALGLLAGTLQMITHSFAKAALFLASAVMEQQTGTGELAELQGIGRCRPLAGAVFTVGALTLAGMPLTLGFVSEWYLLESIMQLFRLHSLTLQIAMALAGALIALAVGFAGFTFVRLVGLTVLGGGGRPRLRPRPAGAASALLSAAGLAAPAVACIAVAAISPEEIRLLARGLSDLVPADTTRGALSSPWVIQPVYDKFSALSPSWLAVELPVLAVVVVAGTVLLSAGTVFRIRRVPPWRSASGGVVGDNFYNAFAFATPTRHVLSNVLMTRSQLRESTASARSAEDAGSVLAGPDLPDGHHGIELREPMRTVGPAAWEGAQQQRPVLQTDVVEVVENFLYRPLLPLLRAVVHAAKKVQCGRLDAYVAYLLLTVVALIAVVAGIS
jgi:formate hydrogenlyase subunit 3/multisubunit Na+/H+ antiporter MnhD subunit